MFPLQIKSGNFWGSVEKSGSGKSTLANLMAGLLDGYDGEVFCRKRRYPQSSS